MMRRLQPLMAIIAVTVLYFCFKALIGVVALSSVAKIVIDAEFVQANVIDVYYAAGFAGSGFRADYHKASPPYPAGVRSALTVPINNHVARKIRIDTGHQPGAVKLYSVTFTSYFGPDIVFNHHELFNRFRPANQIGAFTLQDDHLRVVSIGDDPYLVMDGKLIFANPFLLHILPLLLAGLLVFVAVHLPFHRFPAFSDIYSKTSSSGANFAALDGIRGLAALLVLAQHTGLVMGGGIFGVWLFFCLSGFLLATPFIHRPDRALSGSYMGHYVLRRLKRILPMYFTVITVTMLFLGKYDVAIRHYLFLQADGHYWTVAQEMFFYLLLPIVMAVYALLFSSRRLPAILFFAAAAAGAHLFITTDIVTLYGNNATLRPMVGIFLVGVLAAFVFAYCHDHLAYLIKNLACRRFFSIFGLLVVVGCLISGEDPFSRTVHIHPLNQSGWFGLGAGLLILATLLADRTLLNRIMAWLPLRAIGLVGFSFYLLHPMAISCTRGISMYFFNYYPTGVVLFCLAGAGTYLLSLFTYTYIERPFIMLAADKTVPATNRKSDMPEPQRSALRN